MGGGNLRTFLLAAIESGFLPQDVQIFQSWDGVEAVAKRRFALIGVDTVRYRVFRYDIGRFALWRCCEA